MLDQIRQQQGPGSLQAIHRRGFHAPHALEEVLQFGVEGFDRGGAHLFDEAVVAIHQFAVVGAHRAGGAAVDAEVVLEEIGFHQAAAAVGVEPPHLAVGHLAGGEAGHHAIGEGQGGVHVIDRTIGAATAGGGKPHHRGAGQLQHQIDVVDHQIQHHRHIVGPVGVGAVAPGFEHHDLLAGHHLEQFAEGRVEALDVAHLQQPAGGFGGLDQGGGLLLGGGDRLLDQHVHAGLQGGHADPVMQQGGHSDADCLYLPQQFGVVGEPAAAELRHGQGAPPGIRIRHPHQFRIPQQAEHASVVPAHVADADHPDTHRVHGRGARMGRLSVIRLPHRYWPGSGPARCGGHPS